MEYPAVAYALADRVNALLSSEEAKQSTMGMEVEEFRDWLASQLNEVLDGQHRRVSRGMPKPAKLAVERRSPSESGDYSNVTHAAAVQLLENAPPEVQATYRRARRGGATAPAAMQMALAVIRQSQEAATS